MRKLASMALILLASTAALAIKVGSPAPDFEAQDQNGKAVKLSQYKGKVVVLEWFNKDCPFVKKHYGHNDMQALQKTYTDKGVVWLSVLSSAAGKEGFEKADQVQATRKTLNVNSTTTVLDPEGKVGKLYEAKTTPHMFVIDTKGNLVYNGAIDDNSDSSADPKKAKNYVAMAVDEVLAGKAVTKSVTQPYGCGVKY